MNKNAQMKYIVITALSIVLFASFMYYLAPSFGTPWTDFVASLELPDPILQTFGMDKDVYFTELDDHIFKATDNYGDTANITFIAHNPAGNPMPVQSVVGFNLFNEKYREGIKWGYELNLPNPKFRGVIQVDCNQNLSGQKCGKMTLDFSDLIREYSEPIYEDCGEEFCDIIGYDVKPQSFNISYEEVDEDTFLINIDMLEKYNLQNGDKIVIGL